MHDVLLYDANPSVRALLVSQLRKLRLNVVVLSKLEDTGEALMRSKNPLLLIVDMSRCPDYLPELQKCVGRYIPDATHCILTSVTPASLAHYLPYDLSACFFSHVVERPFKMSEFVSLIDSICASSGRQNMRSAAPMINSSVEQIIAPVSGRTPDAVEEARVDELVESISQRLNVVSQDAAQHGIQRQTKAGDASEDDPFKAGVSSRTSQGSLDLRATSPSLETYSMSRSRNAKRPSSGATVRGETAHARNRSSSSWEAQTRAAPEARPSLAPLPALDMPQMSPLPALDMPHVPPLPALGAVQAAPFAASASADAVSRPNQARVDAAGNPVHPSEKVRVAAPAPDEQKVSGAPQAPRMAEICEDEGMSVPDLAVLPEEDEEEALESTMLITKDIMKKALEPSVGLSHMLPVMSGQLSIASWLDILRLNVTLIERLTVELGTSATQTVIVMDMGNVVWAEKMTRENCQSGHDFIFSLSESAHSHIDEISRLIEQGSDMSSALMSLDLFGTLMDAFETRLRETLVSALGQGKQTFRVFGGATRMADKFLKQRPALNMPLAPMLFEQCRKKRLNLIASKFRKFVAHPYRTTLNHSVLLLPEETQILELIRSPQSLSFMNQNLSFDAAPFLAGLVLFGFADMTM